MRFRGTWCLVKKSDGRYPTRCDSSGRDARCALIYTGTECTILYINIFSDRPRRADRQNTWPNTRSFSPTPFLGARRRGSCASAAAGAGGAAGWRGRDARHEGVARAHELDDLTLLVLVLVLLVASPPRFALVLARCDRLIHWRLVTRLVRAKKTHVAEWLVVVGVSVGGSHQLRSRG